MNDAMNHNMPGMDMPAAAAPSAATNGSMSSGPKAQAYRPRTAAQMLWNWHTIDACFLAESWQIRSAGGFAALCIGVVLLVMLLEALRRAATFYDQHLVRIHRKRAVAAAVQAASRRSVVVTPNIRRPTPSSVAGTSSSSSARRLLAEKAHVASPTAGFRPNIVQQGIRALLHTIQFAVAYWVMLLAMYYNGYILICIFLGAFLGAFVFRWEKLGVHQMNSSRDAAAKAMGCCG